MLENVGYGVTPNEYREAISRADLSQVRAGPALNVTERTSRRWARTGVPSHRSDEVRATLARLAKEK